MECVVFFFCRSVTSDSRLVLAVANDDPYFIGETVKNGGCWAAIVTGVVLSYRSVCSAFASLLQRSSPSVEGHLLTQKIHTCKK